MSHSNSFETKLKSLNSLQEYSNSKFKFLSLDQNTVKCLRTRKIKSRQSRSSQKEPQKKEILGSTFDQGSMMLIQNSNVPVSQNQNTRNINTLSHNQNKQEGSSSFITKQPKYFKNMNMPASVPSHQTSIQPW